VSLLYALQQLMNAVQVTAIYALLSVAFVLFYGVTNRLNLAFGAITMWAAYVTILMISLLEGVTFWPLLLVVMAGMGIALANSALLGFSLHHLALRHLVNRRPQAMLIATIAIAITLEEIMRLINSSRELWQRPFFSDPIRLIESQSFLIQVTPLQIAAVLVAFCVVGLLIMLVKWNRFGIYWRACSEDLPMAALCGVNIPLILTASFILASLCAALAGSLIAMLYGSASFVMGTVIGLKTMFIAVIGGLRSLSGAVLASALLALFEIYWSASLDLAYRDVAAFCILTLVLVLKPEGMRART